MARPKTWRQANGGGPHYCPYCDAAFPARDELVDHLTGMPGCLKRASYKPRHKGKR